MLWIPRIALSPLYVVNEYVLRRPLGEFVTVAERRHWVNAISDLFTFGPNGKYMIVPTALFDFGLLPSVGLYFAGDNAWTRRQHRPPAALRPGAPTGSTRPCSTG